MSNTHWHVMFTLWWAAPHCMWCLVCDEQYSVLYDVCLWSEELSTLWHVMFSLWWAALTGMWCLLYDEQHSLACDAYFMTISAWHCTWEVCAYFQTGHSVYDYIPSLFMFFDLVTWILLTVSAVILSLLVLEGWYRLADIEKCLQLLELCSSSCLFDFVIFFGICCTEGA